MRHRQIRALLLPAICSAGCRASPCPAPRELPAWEPVDAVFELFAPGCGAGGGHDPRARVRDLRGLRPQAGA